MTETAEEAMRQYAPYPDDLADIVKRVRYRPGWQVWLDDIERDEPAKGRGAAGGLTLIVRTQGYDSYHQERGQNYAVRHYFPVPAATYNRASWQRWVFEQLLRVETHEAMEFFAVETTQVEPEDECADCHHEATEHDGRTSTCDECEGRNNTYRHRFVPKNPRVEHPYAATHGPGDDPYVVHDYATEVQRRTRFTGEVLDG